MKVLPVDETGSKTGSMSGPSAKEIAEVLGFKANIEDDTDKVKYSWGFTVDGVHAAIWDYYGSWRQKEWSIYDPENVIAGLFPNAKVRR
jgi:hypothetical protein